jgi:hypothetical protein
MARDGSDRDEVPHASVGRAPGSMTRREFAVRVAGGVTAEASTCAVYPRQTEGPFHLGRSRMPARSADRLVAADPDRELVARGQEQGWTESLERLAAHVASGA